MRKRVITTSWWRTAECLDARFAPETALLTVKSCPQVESLALLEAPNFFQTRLFHCREAISTFETRMKLTKFHGGLF